MKSDKETKPLNPHEIPLSCKEIDLIEDLLKNGCHLYPQKGKVRFPVRKEQKVAPEDLIERRAIWVPMPACSIGLDFNTLPSGISIIDVDNNAVALAFLAYLGEEDGLIVEKTPSGGLHIWGCGLREVKKNALCSAGIRVEYFNGGRITIVGAGRGLHHHTPLA